MEAKHPEQNQWIDGTIAKLTDASTYTVGEFCTLMLYIVYMALTLVKNAHFEM